MKITRINADREVSKVATVIDLDVDGNKFRLTEEFGMLRIHLSDGQVAVIPHCANVVSVIAHKP